MQFQRLRIAGFKSFVDAVDFRIEPGLTGVVGPNGCGKSNLLEALRWVMGANSAKAMRAEGMDDVIFGGSSARPSRNHAEVRLEIDNADRTAPAQFNDHAVLEVVRRIDRGAGSTYRVNGAETRARDVQLLFADASTGANSPALVRQGQISELIGAKPSNRRRILEEAAGVSGLHARRHEAGLRLAAAEANLDRLGDVHQALEAALNRLKREARQAEKYRRLSAEIRALQGAALYARWAEARAGLDEAEADARATAATVEATAREAARATAEAARTLDALPPLRDEAQIAGAVLQRLTIEADRVEREVEQAAREVERLKADVARIAADLTREEGQAADATSALARAARDLTELEAAIADAPHRLPELESALVEAEAARGRADAEVERIAAESAGDAARRQALTARVADTDGRKRAADRRLADAEARLQRTRGTLAAAETERASLAKAAGPDAAATRAQLDAALVTLRDARSAVDSAEAERTAAQAFETETRTAARKLDDRAGQLKAEAKGLIQLARPAAGRTHAPALDAVSPQRGYEAALAAALGEELDAALDTAAPAHWAGAAIIATDWPLGATPLAPLVDAPPALAARLARVALVDRADGERLRALAPVGARLVSHEGDLWRWDGYTVRANAPKPAAVRMAQRTRLTEVEADLARLAPELAASAETQAKAATRLRAADEALRIARRRPEEIERTVAGARDRADQAAREQARREARAQAVEESLARLTEEQGEAQTALDAVRTEAGEAVTALELARREAGSAQADRFTAALVQARAGSARAREAETRARGALDGERRAREGRSRRRESLIRDQGDWKRRADAASTRVAALDREAQRSHAALRSAEGAPAELGAKRQAVMDQHALAEARRRRASDALTAAESAQAAADRSLRAADLAAAQGREARAAADARAEASTERLTLATDQIRQSVHLEPEALGRRIAEDAVAIPADPKGVETHLAALERDRDQLGAVNLLAEEEAASAGQRLEEMRRERADLVSAISKLRGGVEALNAEGRERLLAAFDVINEHFKALFTTLFAGGQAELRLVESDDPLEAGLEIYACPPGKRLAAMTLMSGGEQALTATALIFAVFLAAPAPVCVLDEVDAPLDDANVDRFCRLLDEMRRRTQTRFIAITHNPVTMSRMDRLFGVTMAEPGISQLVSVDLRQAEILVAA